MKSVLKCLFTFGTYYLLVFGFQKLAQYIFIRDEFLDINQIYILSIDIIVYAVLIGLSFMFIHKTNYDNKIGFVLDYKVLLMIMIIVVCFRIIEDPFLRSEIFLNGLTIPENINIVEKTTTQKLITIITTIILAPIFEEVFFRKILLGFFSKKNILIGVIISSFLFAFIHFYQISISIHKLIAFFAFGCICCLIFIRYGIIYSIIFHCIYNLIWFFISVNLIPYWDILRNLNFGVIYWIIIIGAVLSSIYLLLKIYKQPCSAKSPDFTQ